MKFRILAVALLLAAAVFAQSDRSSVTGTVSDPAGAVVASAPILAKNLDTGVEYQAGTTATGNYTLPELPVGRYEITVAVPGFKRFVRQGLQVAAAQAYRIDITLEVGATTDSVTVTEAAPLLKTESGELAHSVTSDNLNTLPVVGIGSGFSGNSGIRQPMLIAINKAHFPVTVLGPGRRVGAAPPPGVIRRTVLLTDRGPRSRHRCRAAGSRPASSP